MIVISHLNRVSSTKTSYTPNYLVTLLKLALEGGKFGYLFSQPHSSNAGMHFLNSEGGMRLQESRDTPPFPMRHTKAKKACE